MSRYEHNEKTEIVKFRADYGLLRDMDAMCQRQGVTRSEYIRGLIATDIRNDGYNFIDGIKDMQRDIKSLKELLGEIS